MNSNTKTLSQQSKIIEIRDAISHLNLSRPDIDIFCKNVDQIARSIQGTYNDDHHPESLAIPFEVFERLLSMLETQLSDFVSNELLEMLYEIPEGFVSTSLIEEQESRLAQLMYLRLEKNPLDCALRLEAGWQCLDDRDWEQAIEHAEVVLKQNPVHSEALQVKGEALSSQGDVHAAYDVLTEWIEASGSTEALFLRAQLLDRHEYRSLARQDVEMADWDELDLDQQLWCIKFFISLKEYTGSLKRLDILNDEADTKTQGWLLQGIALYGLERHEEASCCFEHIVDEVSEVTALQTEAMRWLADTQLALGHFRQALQTYLWLESGVDQGYQVRRGSLRAMQHLIEEHTSQHQEHELLLDIIQHPQTTEARQRYADHLNSLGDPRGKELARPHTPMREDQSPPYPRLAHARDGSNPTWTRASKARSQFRFGSSTHNRFLSLNDCRGYTLSSI